MISIRKKAIFLLVLNASGYSLLNVAVRLMDKGFQPFTQVYLRILIATLVGTFVFRKQLRWKKIKTTSLSDWIILFIMGVVGFALMISFITLGALEAKLLNVSVIYSTVVFFSYLYSIWVLKSKHDVRVLFFVGIALWGVAVLSTGSLLPMLGGFGRGELYVLLSAAAGAWYYVGRKMLSEHLNTSEISIITMLIATLSAFIIAMVFGERLNKDTIFHVQALAGLAIGGVVVVLSTFIENFSFKHLPAVLGSQILLLENVFSVFFGFVLYKEILSLPQIIGAVAVIVSVYLMNKVSE